MSKRKILLLLGDTHAGSEFGLLHPETILEREKQNGQIEKYTPQLSEIQKLLYYEIYKPGLETVMKFAGKDDVIAIHQGDPTQGSKYMTEVLSTRMSDQILIATKNLEEILKYKNVKAFRAIKSTPSHVFGESSADILIGDLLRRSYPDKDIATHFHGEYLLKDVDTLIDVAHHGPGRGKRIWLSGNSFRFYVRDLMLRRIARRKRVPDIISRAHTHGKLEEHLTVEDRRAWGFITPPMQFPSSFVRQITQSVDEVEMGMLMVEIVWHSEHRKSIYPFWLTKKLDITTKEVIC